ncbi:MAG TPA: hypothetical protein VEH77_02710 [Roseiarcus sp.]|nr:hypothetical protein [Roseiarcus sp.]
MKPILLANAVEAAATSLLLILSPSLFAGLVLGAQLPEAGETLGRLGGMGLLSFALTCWPTAAPAEPTPIIRAFVFYHLMASVFLAYLGIGGRFVGVLLWPAFMIHATFEVLLLRHWLVAKSE